MLRRPVFGPRQKENIKFNVSISFFRRSARARVRRTARDAAAASSPADARRPQRRETPSPSLSAAERAPPPGCQPRVAPPPSRQESYAADQRGEYLATALVEVAHEHVQRAKQVRLLAALAKNRALSRCSPRSRHHQLARAQVEGVERSTARCGACSPRAPPSDTGAASSERTEVSREHGRHERDLVATDRQRSSLGRGAECPRCHRPRPRAGGAPPRSTRTRTGMRTRTKSTRQRHQQRYPHTRWATIRQREREDCEEANGPFVAARTGDAARDPLRTTRHAQSHIDKWNGYMWWILTREEQQFNCGMHERRQVVHTMFCCARRHINSDSVRLNLLANWSEAAIGWRSLLALKFSTIVFVGAHGGAVQCAVQSCVGAE
jgi:hypothetical protein